MSALPNSQTYIVSSTAGGTTIDLGINNTYRYLQVEMPPATVLSGNAVPSQVLSGSTFYSDDATTMLSGIMQVGSITLTTI